MKKTLSTITATTRGGRDGHGQTADGRLEAAFNPRGDGLTPEHLFALGWSACFGTALAGVAGMKGVKLPPDASVTVRVDLVVGDAHDYSLVGAVTVSLPGIDRPVAEALVAMADQMCPYSKAVRGNIPATVTLA